MTMGVKVDKSAEIKAREYIERVLQHNKELGGNTEIPKDAVDKAIRDTAKVFTKFQKLSRSP
jgi:hypothetical protein